MRYRAALPALALLAAVPQACTRESPGPTTSPRRLALEVTAPQGLTGGEGELLGDLYVNGAQITDSGYTVSLTPVDPATQARLHFYSGSMWVAPAGQGHDRIGHMFAWIDPRHQGGCGTEYQYVSGDTLDRKPEVHWADATTPPSGFEKHCIQPGTYTLSIYTRGNEQAVRSFQVDYVPTMTAEGNVLLIHDATAGVDESIEKQNWDDTSYVHHDLDVRIDLGAPGYTDTPVLWADSAGGDPYAHTTFTNRGALSGTHHTWFRFTSVGSTTTEPPPMEGGLLSRIYWDTLHTNQKTGFWDSYSWGGIIRVHQFMTDTLATRDYVVGLETMRPDEQPRTTPEMTRMVQIQGPPPPPPSLSAVIHGPNYITATGTYTWFSTVSGGTAPYHYQWYYQRTGQSENPVGTDNYRYSQTVTVEPTPYSFTLRVVVTDASQLTGEARCYVQVGGRPNRPLMPAACS